MTISNIHLHPNPVYRFQWMLRRLGYSMQLTGVFDQRTHRIMRIFQRDLRLPETDGLNSATLEKACDCYDNASQPA